MSGAKYQNQQVNGSSNYKRAAPMFHPEEQRMHMLLVALDYKHTGRPLSCTTAAKSVEELARQCGVQWLTPMYNEECTREKVLQAVETMTSRLGAEDVFVIYFAGHGSSPEDSGATAQASGSHCFVLVDRNGQVSSSTLLPGDELANAVLERCPQTARVVFITDTCHSDTIMDLRRGAWEGREAVAISGTQDPYTKEEDRGSIFTHAVLLAIDKLSKVGRDNYSVGMLVNAALYEDELVFGSKQDVTVQSAPRSSTDAMAWPLVPQLGYQAPLTRCVGPGASLDAGAARRVLSPALLPHVRKEALKVPVSVEEYVSLVQGQSLFNLKLHRACSAGCSTGSCSLQ